MRSKTADIESAVGATASGLTTGGAAAGVWRAFERARVPTAVDGAGTAVCSNAIDGAIAARERDSTRARLVLARQLSGRGAPDNRPLTTSQAGTVDRASRRGAAVDCAACTRAEAVDLAGNIGRARHASVACVVATRDVTGDARGATDRGSALPSGAVYGAGGTVALVAGAGFVRCSAVSCPAAPGCAASPQCRSFVGSERVRVLETGREHQCGVSRSASDSTVKTKRSREPRVALHSRRPVCHFEDAA